MSMKLPHPLVLEMKQLVSEGVSAVHDAGSPFCELHRDLVQRYFKARTVEIDYDAELVRIELPVGERNFTQVNISCQPLEQFLCSCVKNDEQSLEHYQKLLLKFEKTEVA